MRKVNLKEKSDGAVNGALGGSKGVLKAGAGSLCAAVMFGLFSMTAVAGPADAALQTQAVNTAVSQQASYIGAEKAQEIALTHAGLTADQVVMLQAELKLDDGRWEYDVEFYNPASYAEFDYEIDAYAGTILSYDYDAEYYAQPSAAAGANAAGYIGLDRAKSIALDWAGVKADQVQFKKAHLDWDDGRAEYKIEYYYGEYEYEFEIDAVNGTILDYDRDHWRD